MQNADQNELDKFSQLAHRWWDPESEFKPLHQINPLRLDWIDSHASIAGKKVLDIGCGGGKFYTGFSPMPEFVPQFVSLKERYKRTPEMVLDFIAALDLRPGPKAWLEFVRVDAAGTFDGAEGVLFFATPDVLAGLVTWAGFDNDAPDAVAAPFG